MKSSVNIKFGKRISHLRRQVGLSQEKFAEKCDVHRTYIGALERGEKSPTLITIEKIANSLNVSISDLFVEM